MTTEPREQQEPSMEEILSSIRRIIADEEAEDGPTDDDDLGAAEAESEALNEDADALARAAEVEDPDDVLELTKVVRDSGEVVDLKAEGGGRRAHGGGHRPARRALQSGGLLCRRSQPLDRSRGGRRRRARVTVPGWIAGFVAL